MKQQILRLDEAALYALGMDRVTVNALRNMIRVTGNDNTTPTVPEVAEAAGIAGQVIAQLREKIDMLQSIVDVLQMAPAETDIDLSAVTALSILPPPSQQQALQPMEDIRVELRQVSEQVAMLTKAFELDLRPNADQFSQFSNQIITELRQLADQQIVNTNQIQEIKQGTML